VTGRARYHIHVGRLLLFMINYWKSGRPTCRLSNLMLEVYG